MTTELKNYKKYTDGNRYKKRRIEVLIPESTILEIVKRSGKSVAEAERSIMDRMLCGAIDCMGMVIDDDGNLSVNEGREGEAGDPVATPTFIIK